MGAAAGNFMGALMGQLQPTIDKREADKQAQKQILRDTLLKGMQTDPPQNDGESDTDYNVRKAQYHQQLLDEYNKTLHHPGAKELVQKAGQALGLYHKMGAPSTAPASAPSTPSAAGPPIGGLPSPIAASPAATGGAAAIPPTPGLNVNAGGFETGAGSPAMPSTPKPVGPTASPAPLGQAPNAPAPSPSPVAALPPPVTPAPTPVPVVAPASAAAAKPVQAPASPAPFNYGAQQVINNQAAMTALQRDINYRMKLGKQLDLTGPDLAEFAYKGTIPAAADRMVELDPAITKEVAPMLKPDANGRIRVPLNQALQLFTGGPAQQVTIGVDDGKGGVVRTPAFWDKFKRVYTTTSGVVIPGDSIRALPKEHNQVKMGMIDPNDPTKTVREAWVDPRDPHAKPVWVDTGEPVPEGTRAYDVSQMNMKERLTTYGEFGNFYRSAKGKGYDDEKAREIAGEMVFQLYRVRLGRTEQQAAIDAAGSGIGLPKVNMPPSGPAPGSTVAPVTSTVTPKQQSDLAKPPVPAAKAAAAAPAKAAGLSDTEQTDLNTYIGDLLGTVTQKGRLVQARIMQGQRIMSRITGLNPMQLQASLVEDKATAKALGEAVQWAGAFQRLQETMKQHGDVLLAAAKEYGPGHIPILNETIQEIQKQVVAHPELTKYTLALQALQNEYARMVAGGVQSRAMSPVFAMEKGNAVLRPEATMADIKAAVEQIGVEAEAQQRGLQSQIRKLNEKLNTGVVGSALSNASNPPPPPAVNPTPQPGAPKNADEFMRKYGIKPK